MKKVITLILSISLIMGTIMIFPMAGAKYINNGDELALAIAGAQDGDTITLAEGTIRLNENLKISGKTNLTIQSEQGKVTTITNSHPVTGWTEGQINGVRAFYASYTGEKITALYKGEEELSVARLPETGFWYLDEPDLSDTKGKDADVVSKAFYAHDLSFVPAHPGDITVSILHQWVSEVVNMVSYDKATGHIQMDNYTGRPIESGDRYYLLNVLESLDKPGEWACDSDNKTIWYIPYETETTDNINFCASSGRQLIEMANCSGITFKNVRFAETGWDYSGYQYLNMNIHSRHRDYTTASLQGSVDVPGSIEVSYSDNIKFTNCEFENLGDTGIRFFTGTKDCTLDSCHFNNMGGSAIFVGGQFLQGDDVINDKSDLARNITIRNCEVENYARLFNGSCGIMVTYADTVDIINNEIHDGAYTGISAGFMWLFFDNPTQNIHIKDNLIYNIGLDTLSDLGGIYMLGKQPGTVISGNVIHDCACYSGPSGYAGDGLYLDSGCEFMTIENNLVFNCSTSCFNTTLSKNNVLRNNIFALADQSCACLGAAEYGDRFFDLNNSYINNIFLTDNKVLTLEYAQCEEHFKGGGNIMWDVTYGDELYFTIGHHKDEAMTRQSAEGRGILSGVMYVNPGFKDVKAYDFTLSEDSEAVKLGFEPFDYTKAGTIAGTTVGIDIAGGQTKYNADTKDYEVLESRLSFKEKFKAFFINIAQYFKDLFKIKHHDSDLITSDIYTTEYTAKDKNKNSEILASLIDKVKEHTPTYRVDETRKPFTDDDRIQAIYFDGEECMGKETEVFAYIGIPENASKEDPVPAMVLVHGGGVHAQADWVQYWVDRGYAAISFDGFGQQPKVGTYSKEGNNNPDWTWNPNSHLGFSDFKDVNNDYTEQWFYYYLTDIVLSNNILRADERIVTTEIGVAGISWGSLVTTVAACYDDRFEFAIPIYGCGCWEYMGFFNNNDIVMEKWDPTPLLKDVDMPVLYVSSNADPFFSPMILCASAALTKNGSAILIDGLYHAEFRIEETVRFANEYTGNGHGNIRITGVSENDGTLTVTYKLPQDVSNPEVRLYYRTVPIVYKNLALETAWSYKKASVSGNTATVTIPAGTVMYYVDVSAKTGSVFSSDSITTTTGIFNF